MPKLSKMSEISETPKMSKMSEMSETSKMSKRPKCLKCPECPEPTIILTLKSSEMKSWLLVLGGPRYWKNCKSQSRKFKKVLGRQLCQRSMYKYIKQEKINK